MMRGVVSSSAIIAATMAANSVQAAPAGLAQTATAIAFAKGAAASGSTITLIKGALNIMAWTKAKTAIAIAVGLVLAAGTTTIVLQNILPSSLDAYLRDPNLDAVSNAPPMVLIQSTHFAKNNLPSGTLLGKNAGTREIGRNIDLSIAILKAYGVPDLTRVVFPGAARRIRVDYLVTVPDHPRERFQAAIKRQFGWVGHFETRETDVLLLKVHHYNAPGLVRPDNSSPEKWSAGHPHIGIYRHNIQVSTFAELMENLVQKPIIDQTGLAGNFDFNIGSFSPDTLNQTILHQLGLELVPSREPVEMLVVEKAR